MTIQKVHANGPNSGTNRRHCSSCAGSCLLCYTDFANNYNDYSSYHSSANYQPHDYNATPDNNHTATFYVYNSGCVN